MLKFIHDFLKWFPAAIFGVSVGISAVWSAAKDWIAAQAVWAWSAMSDPWVAALIVVALAGYVAAIIFTGDKDTKSGGDTHFHFAPLSELFPENPVVHDATGDLIGAGAIVTGAFEMTGTATGIVGLHGIYVGNIITSASGLADDRRLDFAIVGYNGSPETIRVADVTGRIRAGVGNMRDYVKLETPLFQGVLNAAPFTEFVLQMRQDVSTEQAQQYLEALEQKEHVGLDLRELNIVVASIVDPEKTLRLPLWDGVNLRRRDDIVSSRNSILSAKATVSFAVSGKLSHAGEADDIRQK